MGAKITALLAALGLLSGCGSSDIPAQPTATAAEKPDSAHEDNKPLELTAQERGRLGIVTAPAQAVTFTPAQSGYGVVLSHESIAQAVADLQTAGGAAHVSQTALVRARKLATGPGALGLDSVETLEKQSSADQAALDLAHHKLTALLGEQLPWQTPGRGGELEALASGHARLVRATFPSGIWTGTTPRTLRLFPMDAAAAAPTWRSTRVWDAPQDANIPGRSFFAFIKTTAIPEGSRLQVSDDSSAAAAPGVLIPATAVVISNGAYWCYLEKQAGTFSRVAIDPQHPLGAGYFVSEGIKDGDPVVIASAGLLLARETNSGSAADD